MTDMPIALSSAQSISRTPLCTGAADSERSVGQLASGLWQGFAVGENGAMIAAHFFYARPLPSISGFSAWWTSEDATAGARPAPLVTSALGRWMVVLRSLLRLRAPSLHLVLPQPTRPMYIPHAYCATPGLPASLAQPYRGTL